MRVEKSTVEEVDPQETDISVSGSSETLRKTTNSFDFEPFLRATNRRGGDLISNLQWLIGVTEGDGSFIVDNTTGYVSFEVTQSGRDVQVLYRVRQILQFGTVTQQDKQQNTWRFRVRGKDSLQKIVLLFNGNVVLDKCYVRFLAFVTAFNLRYVESNAVRREAPAVTLRDAWLCGFTDAAGCFTVSVATRSESFRKPYQVHMCYILAQKGAARELRTFIPLIGGRVVFQKSASVHNLTVQLTHLRPILRYFRLFPLKSQKRIVLLKFLAIYKPYIKSIAEKRLLTAEEMVVVRRRAREVNKFNELLKIKSDLPGNR